MSAHYTKSGKNRNEIDRLKQEIQGRISGNGMYYAPAGFVFENTKTSLHVALKELLDEEIIVLGRPQESHDVFILSGKLKSEKVGQPT